MRPRVSDHSSYLLRPALLIGLRKVIERACVEVAPGASLQSACLSAVRIWEEPVAFVTAAVSPKTDGTGPCLRVRSIVANDPARDIGCEIRRQMRVPPASAISRAFGDLLANQFRGMEDQADWEVSGQGSLSPLVWQVEARRRGPVVYGLLSKMTARPSLMSSTEGFAGLNPISSGKRI